MMMSGRVILCILIFFVLVQGVQATNLQISVKDNIDNSPLSHATVFLNGGKIAQTNTLGQVFLTHSGLNDLKIMVSMTGYDDWVKTVGRNETSLLVNMNRKTPLTLKVSLFDSDALMPISGALVNISAENVTIGKQTDISGSALFGVTAATLYFVDIEAANYQPRHTSIDMALENRDVQYWLLPGMLPGNRFAIEIKDKNDKVPLPDAEVRINSALVGKTDSKGRLVIPVTRGNTYTIEISKTGYQTYTESRIISDADAIYSVEITKAPIAGTRQETVPTTVPKTVATTMSTPVPTTSQESPPSPGFDLAGYSGIILIVVVIVVIAGAGVYVTNARKASSHLRVPDPPKMSPPIKSSPPQSQSRSPSPQKTVDPKFIQPETPKELPQELSDRYTDFELIGKGGFARVFKATRTDGKQVAIKIPISLDSSTGKTFIAELQNWTKLDHPNIVRVFDYNIMPLPYFEMELCDGSLAEAKIPMDCEEAAWFVFHICEGLKYAHARFIAHRDLKPQNILLKDNIPKISDWGLSRIISKSTSTTTGSFTPYYAAPEQVNNKQKDERTDIWQLGVILYELTTGTLPFNGESVVDVVVGISTKSYPPPSELNPNAKQIEPIISLCLQKDPNKRFQAVGALQTALGMYLRKNYAEMFRQSVSVKDIRRSAYYVGDLIIVNLIIGDLNAAYKYSTDLVVYAKGDTKTLAQELCDHLYIRIQNDVTEVPDELLKKAEFVVHKVLMGF